MSSCESWTVAALHDSKDNVTASQPTSGSRAGAAAARVLRPQQIDAAPSQDDRPLAAVPARNMSHRSAQIQTG
jgi:hypothetical protein